MTISRTNIGKSAETLALAYLTQFNLKLIRQNFYSRFGEIDIIMQDTDCLVFVEVRKRKSGIDNAIESISNSKRKKLITTARYFLSKIGRDVNCRFDLIAIDGNDKIEWLKNIITL